MTTVAGALAPALRRTCGGKQMAKQSPDSTAAAKPKAPRTRRSKAPAEPTALVDTAADGVSAAVKAAPTAEDIRERAYHLYLERGGNDGSELDDWVRAEAELQKG
jgi:hypothetical protein